MERMNTLLDRKDILKETTHENLKKIYKMQAKSCKNIFRVYQKQDNFLMELKLREGVMSQTLFSHISINSLTILIVSKAMESSQKDLLINASHVSRQSILANILSRSTGNHYVTVYSIANISKTTMINTLVLGSAEAFFIMLRMSLERPQGN